MNKDLMFSSASVEWATPQELYDELEKEFEFNLDPCATHENHKCGNYYTKEQDGLSKDWDNMRVFMNPPYGREIGKWVHKAFTSMGGVVVCLLPARTDTKWFHEYIYNQPTAQIRFIKGRIKFGGHKNPAPFPSMIVVFK